MCVLVVVSSVFISEPCLVVLGCIVELKCIVFVCKSYVVLGCMVWVLKIVLVLLLVELLVSTNCVVLE